MVFAGVNILGCILITAYQVSGLTKPNYRITTITHAPYVMPKNGGGYQGIIVDILDELSKRANFTYTLKLVADGKFGSPNRGENVTTWNGMIGEIHRNETDIAAAAMLVVPERAEVVRYTQPFMDAGMRILYKRPTDWMSQESLFVLLSVFSPGLWVVILLMIPAFAALFFVIGRFSPLEDASLGDDKRVPEGLTITNSFLYAFGSLSWQGSTTAPRSLSGRTLAAFWWMFSLFTIVAFTANLTAYFLTQEPNVSRVPFTTFYQLARQRHIEYGTFNFGSSAMFFHRSRHPLSKRLWAVMSRRKNLIGGYNVGLDRVRKGNFALIVDGPYAQYTAGKPPCDLVVVGAPLSSIGYSFACNKTSSICPILDEKILQLKEDDTISDSIKKWMNRGCNSNQGQELVFNGVSFFDTFGSKASPINDKSVTLRRFGSGFVLLFIGILLAGVCLVVEIIYAKREGYQLDILSGMKKPDQERIQDS